MQITLTLVTTMLLVLYALSSSTPYNNLMRQALPCSNLVGGTEGLLPQVACD